MFDIKERYVFIINEFRREIDPNFKPDEIDSQNIINFLRNENSNRFNIEVLKFNKVKDFKDFNTETYLTMKIKHLEHLKKERRRTNENEY